MELTQKKCVPCEGGVPRLTAAQIEPLARQIAGWTVDAERKLKRRFLFEDFVSVVAFLNQVAALAEAEAHHPDFSVHYSVADFEIWTHAIGGLSENDFILAAKIDALAEKARGRVKE